MNKILASIATASITVGAVSFIAPEASAVTVSFDGTDYEITTITGTFEDNQATLESQPWWGNATLAEGLAGELGLAAGFTGLYYRVF